MDIEEPPKEICSTLGNQGRRFVPIYGAWTVLSMKQYHILYSLKRRVLFPTYNSNSGEKIGKNRGYLLVDFRWYFFL